MAPNLPPLLLSGFMGTGKTTAGRILAERAGVPFLDLDAAIEEEAGESIEAIFAGSGEASFRSLEAAVLRRVLDEPGPRVVALGGGALVDPTSRIAATSRARVVTLLTDPATIAERTAGSARPVLGPLMDPAGPERLARIRDLLAKRAPAYAESHAQIRTDGRTPEAVAEAIHKAWLDPCHLVPLGLRSYPVRITPRVAEHLFELTSALRPSGIYLVTDTTVRDLWGAPLARIFGQTLGGRIVASIAIDPGEPSKRLSVVEHLLTSLIEAGADRDALIVAHGGGVVSDIAGFVAATLFRGVRWVAVPTTLLAMVDASIGGKTGVDLGDAKNAVGAFHQPSAVFIDPAHVTTETERAFESGLAEVVKSACVGDVPLFDLLEREADRVRDPSVVAELVSRSAALKIRIIARDERDAGERAFLNFGHTLGHALEAQGGYARLTHGEAVSLGMVAALRVGRELGLTEPSTVDRVTHLLARLGLPTDLASQPVEDALRLLGRDKKRSGSTLRAIFLRRLGEPLLYPIDVGDLGARYLRAASLP